MSTPSIAFYKSKYADSASPGYPSLQETCLIVVKSLLSLATYFNEEDEGVTPGSYISLASVNSTVVVAAPTKLRFLAATNKAVTPAYLKIFNSSVAPVVASTPVFRFLIPGNTSGTGSNLPLPDGGINLPEGFSFLITGGPEDGNNVAVAAGDVIVNYGYKE